MGDRVTVRSHFKKMSSYFYTPVIAFIVTCSLLGHFFYPNTQQEKEFFLNYVNSFLQFCALLTVGLHVFWSRFIHGKPALTDEIGFVTAFVILNGLAFFIRKFIRKSPFELAELVLIGIAMSYTIQAFYYPKDGFFHWWTLGLTFTLALQHAYLVFFWSIRLRAHHPTILAFFRGIQYIVLIPAYADIRYQTNQPYPDPIVILWILVFSAYWFITSLYQHTSIDPLSKYEVAPLKFSLLTNDQLVQPTPALQPDPVMEELNLIDFSMETVS